MIDAFLEICRSGEIWTIIIKVLLGIVLSGLATLLGTIIVKVITGNKESKIYKYAKTLVEAAEQKYPNEGTKMGPQKMDYVMGQLCIKFPNIKDNRYFYNIVESAVYKFNEERQKQKEIEQFELKHGKGSYVLETKDREEIGDNSTNNNNNDDKVNNVNNTITNQNKSSSGLKSF